MAKKRADEPTTERHPAAADLPDEYVWKGPLPKVWRKRPPAVPCARCRAVQDRHASQAVVAYGVKEKEVYLQCRVCRHQFTMPVAKGD